MEMDEEVTDCVKGEPVPHRMPCWDSSPKRPFPFSFPPFMRRSNTHAHKRTHKAHRHAHPQNADYGSCNSAAKCFRRYCTVGIGSAMLLC